MDLRDASASKNKYAHKKKNQAKSSWEKFLNPILKILSGGFVLKKIWAHIFFVTPPTSPKKHFIFDQTLSSSNSGLRNYSIKTTTFSETAGRQLSYGIPGNLFKKSLRLHSFGPLRIIMQTQTLFSLLQNFLRGMQGCHMKADVLPFLKMWWFLCYNFLFQASILNQCGPNGYVLRLIQCKTRNVKLWLCLFFNEA